MGRQDWGESGLLGCGEGEALGRRDWGESLSHPQGQAGDVYLSWDSTPAKEIGGDFFRPEFMSLSHALSAFFSSECALPDIIGRC